MNAKTLVAAVAVFILGVVVTLAWAEEKGSSSGPEGRYRLHNGTNRDMNLVLKIDTATGKTWVLSKSGNDWDDILD